MVTEKIWTFNFAILTCFSSKTLDFRRMLCSWDKRIEADMPEVTNGPVFLRKWWQSTLEAYVTCCRPDTIDSELTLLSLVSIRRGGSAWLAWLSAILGRLGPLVSGLGMGWRPGTAPASMTRLGRLTWGPAPPTTCTPSPPRPPTLSTCTLSRKSLKHPH